MAKPGKALKRSARSIERVSRNTGKRVDEAQAALQAGTYDANMFARHAAGQTFDMLQLWFGLFGAADSGSPEVYIDIAVTGGGGQTSGNATVELDEPIAKALLQATALVSPAGTIPAANVTLTAVPAPADPVEVLKIVVQVPNSQAQTLYRGFITDGAAVQVEVSVFLHT